MAENFLTKLRAGEYTGTKPTKGGWSDMYPPMGDGLVLAKFVMELPQVLSHMAREDPQDLAG